MRAGLAEADVRTFLPCAVASGVRESGIHGERWVPLHATVEGWVEALALADHAMTWAQQITKVTGEAVDGLQLSGFEPVAEVRYLADSWWRGVDSLVAVYTGQAACLGVPGLRSAWTYSGLDQWGLRGGV